MELEENKNKSNKKENCITVNVNLSEKKKKSLLEYVFHQNQNDLKLEGTSNKTDLYNKIYMTNNLSNLNKKDIDQSQKSIIPESELSEEYQNEFTKLFTSFEYKKGQKFPQMSFKKVLSSKGLTSDKLRAKLTSNVSNQGPFLIILYPSKLEKHNKCITFFFYNGVFPSITFSQNLDESDESLIIPYNAQNMICQISEKIT